MWPLHFEREIVFRGFVNFNKNQRFNTVKSSTILTVARYVFVVARSRFCWFWHYIIA